MSSQKAPNRVLFLRKITKFVATMSDFKVKMHQIRFRLGLRPRPRWRSLQRSPDPLAGFKGPTSKEREGKAGNERGKGKEKKRGEWKEGRVREWREGGEGKGRL